MSAKVFDSDASLDERKLSWGLQPSEVGGRPFTVIRAEGRTFPSHRCLVPASEFRHRSRGKPYSFSLADDDWLYFAGVWRQATRDWPEAYAILTIEANDDVAPFHDRQMAVLRRDQRMAWLDGTCMEEELLRPLPAGTFVVSQPRETYAQAVLAF
ncbi:SOS response-associated peptidase [Mesorhizobium sp. M1423]|uniref:SOS response-associated peptidase n=1 Tax=Mesorhizobium sp. M1423 TaxID=2957101 RepID=UPI003338C773